MKFVYAAVITPSQGQYTIFVPDFNLTMEHKDLNDLISKTRMAIIKMGLEKEEQSGGLPYDCYPRYSIEECSRAYVKDNGAFCTLIDCDFEEYRKRFDNRAVKKNCTIPAWLCKEAEYAGINFSETLQEALLRKLHPSENTGSQRKEGGTHYD